MIPPKADLTHALHEWSGERAQGGASDLQASPLSEGNRKLWLTYIKWRAEGQDGNAIGAYDSTTVRRYGAETVRGFGSSRVRWFEVRCRRVAHSVNLRNLRNLWLRSVVREVEGSGEDRWQRVEGRAGSRQVAAGSKLIIQLAADDRAEKSGGREQRAGGSRLNFQ